MESIDEKKAVGNLRGLANEESRRKLGEAIAIKGEKGKPPLKKVVQDSFTTTWMWSQRIGY